MSIRYLLDTNIISHIMQGRDAALLAKLQTLAVGDVALSSVSLGELTYGIHRKGNPSRLVAALEQVLLRMDVLPWTKAVALRYGKLCADLESKGINLSDLDMMIAAHALAEKLTLVSRDKAFLQLRDELGVEIW
ncbi:MAG: type II toxin-antitoxin system VapC family toxin [Cytophagales bacterium]|nr:type II toxin-antitoxin system VapC family toxin [Cytophagales bacterium]